MNKYITRFNYSIKNIFTKTPKNQKCLKRLDKISIFEYFNIVEERKNAKMQEILVKEIADYINSDIFENEFRHSLSNDAKKFKFLLLNVNLLCLRLDSEKIQITDSNFLIQKKLLLYYRYLPLKISNSDVIRNFITQNQIEGIYNHIIESEMFKKFTKIDLKNLNFRSNFMKDIQSPEEEFKKNLKQFFFPDEKEVDDVIEKLYTYIIAHVNKYLIRKIIYLRSALMKFYMIRYTGD
jgi:hypothetical protein